MNKFPAMISILKKQQMTNNRPTTAQNTSFWAAHCDFDFGQKNLHKNNSNILFEEFYTYKHSFITIHKQEI